MSAFTRKLNQIKQNFASDYGLKKPVTFANCNSSSNKRVQPHSCLSRVKSLSRCEIKVSSPECKQQNYIIRQPVIIQTKNAKKKSYSMSIDTNRKYSSVRKTVEPFVPLVVPTRDRTNIKKEIQSMQTVETARKNHEIQIFIEKDKSQSKECLQKLFKKIHQLEEQLGISEKQRHKLEVEVQHLRKRNKQCNDHEKIINKLQGDRYKLQRQVEMLKKELKDQNRRTPKETIKEIVIEKPVQVRIEVPKYIQGPERIVEKIIQKKVPVQLKSLNPPQIVQKPVYIQVQKPVYLDKPIYVDKPVQRIVQKQVQIPMPYQVPFQVPVYIDRPVIDQEWMMRLHSIEQQLGLVMRQNHELKADNHRLRLDNQNLRSNIDQLSLNMQILQQHNQQKNREVEYLLRNGQDYVPVCNDSFTTKDNSFSSRQINYMTMPFQVNYMSTLPSSRSKKYF